MLVDCQVYRPLTDKHNIQFLNFVSEVTSPYFFLIWASCMMACYYFFDQPLAQYMRVSMNQTIVHVDRGLTVLGEGRWYAIAAAVGWLTVRYIQNHRERTRMANFFIFSLLLTSSISFVIKVIVSRYRPHEWFVHGAYGFHFWQFHASAWSFPSGHTITITTVAMVLSYWFPRYWRWFMAMMLVIATSRVVVGAHYLSDVMAGMYLGVVLVAWVARRYAQSR